MALKFGLTFSETTLPHKWRVMPHKGKEGLNGQ